MWAEIVYLENAAAAKTPRRRSKDERRRPLPYNRGFMRPDWRTLQEWVSLRLCMSVACQYTSVPQSVYLSTILTSVKNCTRNTCIMSCRCICQTRMSRTSIAGRPVNILQVDSCSDRVYMIIRESNNGVWRQSGSAAAAAGCGAESIASRINCAPANRQPVGYV
jgi:hypothetical protein